MIFRIIVPDDVDFSQLQLERTPGGGLRYRENALVAVCEASGLRAADVVADEDLASWVIAHWYQQHRAMGGTIDRAVEAALFGLGDDAEAHAGQLH